MLCRRLIRREYPHLRDGSEFTHSPSPHVEDQYDSSPTHNFCVSTGLTGGSAIGSAGDEVVIPPEMTHEDAEKKFGKGMVRHVTRYVSFLPFNCHCFFLSRKKTDSVI